MTKLYKGPGFILNPAIVSSAEIHTSDGKSYLTLPRTKRAWLLRIFRT